MFIQLVLQKTKTLIYINPAKIIAIKPLYTYGVDGTLEQSVCSVQTSSFQWEVVGTQHEIMEKINKTTQSNRVLEKLEAINDNINEGIGEVINTINPR